MLLLSPILVCGASLVVGSGDGREGAAWLCLACGSSRQVRHTQGFSQPRAPPADGRSFRACLGGGILALAMGWGRGLWVLVVVGGGRCGRDRG